MLMVVPILMALFVAVAGAYFMFEKKSLAQSLCVQQAVRMQTDLGKSLEKLMALNPQSRALRKQRLAADRAVKIARLSKHPGAIATAQANLLAVILAQTQHRGRQQFLLSEAEQTRARYFRQLRDQLHKLKVSRLKSRGFYFSALAVRPAPVSSLTPDYLPAEPFAFLQQHRFGFEVDLEPSFVPKQWRLENMKQKLECSTTLKSEDKKWDVRIFAASAHSSYSWH